MQVLPNVLSLTIPPAAAGLAGRVPFRLLKLSDAPGSDNGTGFFQTLTALKLREIYEKITSKSAAAVSA